MWKENCLRNYLPVHILDENRKRALPQGHYKERE